MSKQMPLLILSPSILHFRRLSYSTPFHAPFAGSTREIHSRRTTPSSSTTPTALPASLSTSPSHVILPLFLSPSSPPPSSPPPLPPLPSPPPPPPSSSLSLLLQLPSPHPPSSPLRMVRSPRRLPLLPRFLAFPVSPLSRHLRGTSPRRIPPPPRGRRLRIPNCLLQPSPPVSRRSRGTLFCRLFSHHRHPLLRALSPRGTRSPPHPLGTRGNSAQSPLPSPRGRRVATRR